MTPRKLIGMFQACLVVASVLLLQAAACAQNATLQISVTVPADFSFPEGDSAPSITCTQTTAPYTAYHQQLSPTGGNTLLATLSVPPDFAYLCALSAPINGLDTSGTVAVQGQSGQVSSGTISLSAYDSDVTLTFVTNVAGAIQGFAIPSGSPDAVAFCMDSDFEHSYPVALKAGDTSVTIFVPGGMSYYCQVAEVSGYGSGMMLLDVGTSSHVASQAAFVPFDGSVVISLVDAEQNPVAVSVPVEVYCGTNDLPFNFPPGEIGAGQSSATIPLTAGHTYSCNVSPVPGYAAIYTSAFFLAENESAKAVQLPLAELNEHLVVSLQKSDSSPYLVGADEYVYVNCQGPSFLTFFEPVPAGESSVDISVLPGNYSCWASVPGSAVAQGTASVAQGTAGALTLAVIDRSAGAHIRLVNQASQAVTVLAGIKFSVWPRDAGVVDWSWGDVLNGEASVSIAPDIAYRVMISSGSGCGQAILGSDQNHYLTRCESLEVQAATGAVREVPISVLVADAVVRVSAKKADGSALSGVGVQAVETPQSAGSEYPLISSAVAGVDGAAEIRVVSGKSYRISLLSVDSRLGLAPPEVPVSPAAGGESDVTLQYTAVDFRLGITASVQGVDHGVFSCYAYDDAGHLVVNEYGLPLGQRLTLAVVHSSTWHLGCSGGNEAVYFSTDEIAYVPPSGQSSDEITVSPAVGLSTRASRSARAASESLTFHIDGQTFAATVTGSVGSANVISPVSGISVRVPAGALDTAQSEATISISHAAGLAANADVEPLRSTATAVDARDSAGNTLGLTQGKTFSVVITLARADFGNADPQTVQGAFYNPTSGTFTPVATEVASGFDSSGAVRYTLTVSRMGTYVLLRKREAAPSPTPTPTPVVSPTPLPVELPGAPRGITAKLEKGRLVISWRAPLRGGSVGSYALNILRGKSLVAVSSVSGSTRRYTLSRKVIAGTYTVKVTAVNSAGRSKALQQAFVIKGRPGALRIR